MEQKNKGGRPTKTLSEKRKYQVLLRLNTMEYYTLLGKAREASITRTEFLRRLITKAEVKACIQLEEMQLIRTISGMATNLNQIAHRLNAFGISALNEDLNALKVLIHELIKRLKP
ncbi:plasmid mobilization protein [Prevotella jejuni]|uniref:plasmid mobilization protein n=1 Tax=Prevotella jejuni TaxID=1177574 RepID=UPI0028DCBD03|nr:plasmid mobilization relaxosome protein MobC [Prevotella jejuni]